MYVSVLINFTVHADYQVGRECCVMTQKTAAGETNRLQTLALKKNTLGSKQKWNTQSLEISVKEASSLIQLNITWILTFLTTVLDGLLPLSPRSYFTFSTEPLGSTRYISFACQSKNIKTTLHEVLRKKLNIFCTKSVSRYRVGFVRSGVKKKFLREHTLHKLLRNSHLLKILMHHN